MISTLIEKYHQSLSIIQTNEKPILPTIEGIKIVLFDIYGTLLVSGTGDVGVSETSKQELHWVNVVLNTHLLPEIKGEDKPITNRIKLAHKTRHDEGIAYPEIDIREIWQALLKDYSINLNHPDILNSLCVSYEMITNPVDAMPELTDTLYQLSRKYPLGIISNAQFYTPPILSYFLEKSLDEAGFDKELCMYSYEAGQGKPSLFMYEKMNEKCQDRGIQPSEIIYIGNDRLKDIYPANKMGWNTVLFAGDKRSLRLRTDDERACSSPPDAVVTTLSQLLNIII